MKTKSIRIPDEVLLAIHLVEKKEHIEESTAIRKLLKIGFETYVARSYVQGGISLREMAKRLALTQIETIDLLLDMGIGGNLDVPDVVGSMDRFLS